MPPVRVVAAMLVVACAVGCGSRADTKPDPSPAVQDPVAAALCPLAEASMSSDADVDALAKRAATAQQDVRDRSFAEKYRPLTSLAFALQGAATSLANINRQVPSEQRAGLPTSNPLTTYRQNLTKAQADLGAACAKF